MALHARDPAGGIRGRGLRLRTPERRPHDHADCEVYDYPGEYLQKADGDHYVQARLDELQSQFELAHGTCNARGVCVGRTFKLVGQPRDDLNREYMVLSANYQLEFS